MEVIKEKLLTFGWDLNDLWKTPISLQQGEFVIKPYNMSIDDLYKWREKFDKMRYKYWTTNPLQRDSMIIPRTKILPETKFVNKSAVMYETILHD